MPKTKKHISSGNWIKLDVKRQSNSKELLALIETIDGVQMKEESGVTFVQFPARKSPVITETKGKRIKQRIRKMEAIISRSSKADIEKDKEHHYCAIMLK